MSETNPSLVSSELTTIETFKDTTEKRRSTLTLNELNYISDKQLHKKTDEEGGGGSGDSPVNVADVRFTTDDTMYSGYLDNVFPDTTLSIYCPDNGTISATIVAGSFRKTIADWNAEMDEGIRVVAPQHFMIASDSFNVSVISGSAEIIEMEDVGSFLYITGDCTIQISVKGESH